MSASTIVWKNATEIADWRLCVGCGACVPACDSNKLQVIDLVAEGIRPAWASGQEPDAGGCGSCTKCVDVCPGIGVDHAPMPAGASAELEESWGPVLEIWEGWATDGGLRDGGSSAGMASALALHAVEERGMAGVLHVGTREGARWLNRTVFSRTRDELLARTGSRYAPASPCDGLAQIEHSDAPCVFIGKPCDVEALRKSQRQRPALDAKVGLAIGIFCAGTPSTRGTLDLLENKGIDPGEIVEMRYRGRGWPGHFAVRTRDDPDWRDLATYAEAWDFVQAYRPQRCHLCPDGTSEFADVSCGDPWYLDTAAHQPGLSLVVVRTEKGRAAVRAAMAAGRVELHPVGPEALERSQRELRRKRGAIWGRIVAMRAMGVPAPTFTGFHLLRCWLRMPLADKARSVLSTLRRVVTRGWRRPLPPARRPSLDGQVVRVGNG